MAYPEARGVAGSQGIPMRLRIRAGRLNVPFLPTAVHLDPANLERRGARRASVMGAEMAMDGCGRTVEAALPTPLTLAARSGQARSLSVSRSFQ